MHHEDQSLQKLKVHAEDVAYAAFHDTVCDVQQELTKYDECAAFSEAKLWTAFNDIDVLKNKVDTAYNVLLDAALSPPSSRLRRCKANLETRIEELQNLLSSNVSNPKNDQREQCLTLEPDCENENKSRDNVDTTECDYDDPIRIDAAAVPSYNTSVLLLTVSILLTVAIDIDSKQSCPENPDLIDDLTVTSDEDRLMKRDIVPGYRTCGVMYKEMNMTMMCIADCSDADTHDLVCERCSISGLKHRWRWKL